MEQASEHLGIDPQRDLMQHVTNLIRDPAFSSYLNKGEFDSEVSITGSRATASKPVTVAIRVHPYGQKRKLLLSRDVTAVQQAEAMRRDSWPMCPMKSAHRSPCSVGLLNHANS